MYKFALLFLILVVIIVLCIMSSKTISGSGEIQLAIQDPWLTEIIEGRKTVEGRAAKAGDFKSWIGKTIKVFNSKKSAQAKVEKVVHYDNLDDYLDVEWEKAASHLNSKEEAKKAYLDIYYFKNGSKVQVFGPDRIAERGGMEAIYLTVLK